MRLNWKALYFSFLITFSGLCTHQTEAARTKYNFNSDWRLHVGDAIDAEHVEYNDTEWQKITLPFAWNQDEA
ncbi:MAG: hypothetical protein PHQ26_10155, partial [Bacteroidales bacterium]|nr:hypothetical protein [Bacteroidales bacterium]